MSLTFADNTKETCSCSGTSNPYSLLGAETGYQAFSASVANIGTTPYAARGRTTNAWEIGTGTYASSGDTLARTTIKASSTGSAINWTAETIDIYIDFPAFIASVLGVNYPYTSGSNIFIDSNGNIAQDNANNYYSPTGGPSSTPTAQFGPRASNPIDASFEFYAATSGANIAHFHNTGSQGSTGGAIVNLSSVPSGAAISSGSRLGSLQYAGSQDTSQTSGAGAAINGLATENWSSSDHGSQLVFNTVPNGSTTRTTALTLGQDQSATFAGAVYLPAQTANQVFAGPTTGSAATPAFRALVAADIPACKIIAKGFSVNGNGAVPNTGNYGIYLVQPSAGTIVGWAVLANASGSVVVDIQKATISSGAFSSFASICGGAYPALSSAQAAYSSSVSAWSTSVAAGDVWELLISSIATITSFTVIIYLEI